MIVCAPSRARVVQRDLFQERERVFAEVCKVGGDEVTRFLVLEHGDSSGSLDIGSRAISLGN